MAGRSGYSLQAALEVKKFLEEKGNQYIESMPRTELRNILLQEGWTVGLGALKTIEESLGAKRTQTTAQDAKQQLEALEKRVAQAEEQLTRLMLVVDGLRQQIDDK